MKKFISLALAAAMTLSLVPVSAFASTDNRITSVVTVAKDTILDSTAPTLVIKNDKGDLPTDGKVTFGLKLDGATWEENSGLVKNVTIEKKSGTGAGTISGEKVTYVSETSAIVEFTTSGFTSNEELQIQLDEVKVTGEKATITIDPRSSAVSADTFTFAKSSDGSTIATIDDTTDFQDGGKIKDIVIEEVAPGSFNVTSATDEIKLKLNSGFKFGAEPTITVVTGSDKITNAVVTGTATGSRDAAFDLQGNKTVSTPAVIKISNLVIDEDGADFGDVAEITISGDGVTKQTLEVGKLVDFGVSATAEDKDLPTIYSGVAVDGDNNETLELTVKENIAASWLVSNRKTTFTFPEGVKVQAVNVEDATNIDVTEGDNNTTDFIIDGNEVTLKSGKTIDSGKKGELKLTFDLVVAPDFTGDIKCTVGGPAVSENIETTVAKAVAPITVEAEKTSVAIDYRNVAVGDITVKEAEAGLWGKDEKITLKVDNMDFEKGMTAEVVEGDGEIKDLVVDKNNGTIEITVKSESSKAPMNIKISNVSLYLGRSLPAGDYGLSLIPSHSGTADITADPVKDVMFATYNKEDGNAPTGADKGKFGFDVDEVEVLKDYVTVATAGRDQGTTFTTNVVVTIDSTTMVVDGKEVTLDVPAYLSAEGWTMLPVRAVTEALATSSNSEPIDWIAGNPGTIMIYYGDKTVSMTLGSTTMYINGTPVPMSTAPVIVNDRAFLPMRDLGRALGLSDSQIAWDATARTATFNPVAE